MGKIFVVPVVNDFGTSHALRYHEATKHSELSVRTSAHYLDWESKPKPFKVYTKVPVLELPRQFPVPEANALVSVSGSAPLQRAKDIDLETLAELLFFSAGITREFKGPGGTYYMRAAPATGALYPNELYVVCRELHRLEAGVYHFCPADFSLSQLRRGDWRGALSSYAGDSSEVGSSPVTIILTSLAWRNAWKYQARSYRHWFWDGGVIAANLLGTASAAGLRSSLLLGFEDDPVNRLLGLGERQEAAIAICPVGIGLDEDVAPAGSSDVRKPAPIEHEYLPLSAREEMYPEIWDMHEASYLHNASEVRAWPNAKVTSRESSQSERRYNLQQTLPAASEKHDLARVILQRGSTRRFSKEAISYGQLSRILWCSTRGVPADFLRDGSSLIDVYLIVNAVQGLPGGSYYFDRSSSSLGQLKPGEFRNMSGYLCLEQPLFSSASFVAFLMTRLNDVLGALGNRGYRAAQFEAGVMSGKMYLAAYAEGIGASGSTFYDDAVTEFFSPHAEGKATMMAVGFGVPGYRAKAGTILVGRLTRQQLIAGRGFQEVVQD